MSYMLFGDQNQNDPWLQFCSAYRKDHAEQDQKQFPMIACHWPSEERRRANNQGNLSMKPH